MNEREKANRIARDAIVSWLVISEQPKTEQEHVDLMRAWDRLPFKDLLEAKAYNMQRNPYTNAMLAKHMEMCIQEAEKVKTTA